MDNLESLRQEIDSLDDRIQRLLVQRMKLTDEVGRVKRNEQRAVLDNHREQMIYQHIAATYTDDEAQSLQRIYERIMEESKVRQHRM